MGRLITNLDKLRVAISLCGSRKELAKRARIKKGRITEWLNQTRTISFIQAIRIEMAVKGQVSRFELVTHLDADVREYLMEEQIMIQPIKQQTTSQRTLSQRVALGFAYERALKVSKITKNHRPNCENFHKKAPLRVVHSPMNGSDSPRIRRDMLAAKAAGFGNYRTYREAKAVVARNVPALTAAVDQGSLSIYRAAQLARYSDEKLAYYLERLGDKRKLIRLMKAEKRSSQPMLEQLSILEPMGE